VRLPAEATGSDAPVRGDREGELREFVTICHHAAQATSGTVDRIAQVGVIPNFHTVVIAYDDDQVAVLRHAELPLVALAEPCPASDSFALQPVHLTRSFGAARFIDRPLITAVITEFSDLRVMSAEELNAPLSRVDLSELSAGEHSEIAYWKPDTVGDLLFNFWD